MLWPNFFLLARKLYVYLVRATCPSHVILDFFYPNSSRWRTQVLRIFIIQFFLIPILFAVSLSLSLSLLDANILLGVVPTHCLP
jgi:TRAP-type mannitol/chloroaromatic compound transport system permease small subunit